MISDFLKWHANGLTSPEQPSSSRSIRKERRITAERLAIAGGDDTIGRMAESEKLGRSNRDSLLALIAWYREAGVTDVVDHPATDWLERGNQPPPSVSDLISFAENRDAVVPSTPPDGNQIPSTLEQRRSPKVAPHASQSRVSERQAPTIAPSEAAEDARQIAAAATDLASLRSALERFDGCGLRATAKNLCFFRGSDQARVMVIGEAPGRDEDRTGRPFVGRAGQLLDRMLMAISLDESQVHITNVVYWRPPGNRTPTPHEVLICRPFLDRQIALVDPKIIVAVGGPAA
ncbi:MAG: uracil-DNA glycosylase, partial [Hyphomicrobiaceae bacterium]